MTEIAAAVCLKAGSGNAWPRLGTGDDVTAGLLLLELRDDEAAAAAEAGAAAAAAAVVGDGLRRAAPEMDTFPRET